MSHHDEDLLKELKKLKTKSSLDSKQKESMKMTLREHAKKKQKHTKHKAKTKKTFIWFSTAAAILICGVFVYYIANNNQIAMPMADQESSEQANEMSKDTSELNDLNNPEEQALEGRKELEGSSTDEDTKENTENESTSEQESHSFSIQESGQEQSTILIEGMEEEVTIFNYTLEPAGIQFQMEEFLNNYTVQNNQVRFYSDAENAEIRLGVEENTTVEQVLPTIQEDYKGENDAEPTPEGENSYNGMMQHFSEPPRGFYLYKIDNHVLIVQYEYIIEAGDGMGPRLEALRKSIQ